MKHKRMKLNKHLLGIYYTPTDLAAYLLSLCPNNGVSSVFDPACGEGALLRAASEKYCDSTVKYIGCDKHMPKILEKKITAKEIDFFDYGQGNQYDLVVMNPPYVRYDKCGDKARKWFEVSNSKVVDCNKRSDLWVYFVLKGITHLKQRGCLSAILPWSFLQSDYAKSIRKHLCDTFGRILCQVIFSKCFSDTPQKVALIWLYDKGNSCVDIRLSIVRDLTVAKDAKFKAVNKTQWVLNGGMRTPCFWGRQNLPIKTLGEFCQVKIGIVTGATPFFILPKSTLLAEGISVKDTIPIITSSKSLNSLNISRSGKKLKRLVIIDKRNEERYKRYIENGAKVGYDKRVHCKNRANWYSLKIPQRRPDALFTYRSTVAPLMVINTANLQCTNAILGLYFEANVTENTKKWIQLSLLSAVSLLDIEARGRVYGKDVLKIEPTALKSVRVYVPNEDVDEEEYGRVNNLIKHGMRDEAIKVASSYIMKHLGFSVHKQNKIMNRYCLAREIRTGVKPKISMDNISGV